MSRSAVLCGVGGFRPPDQLTNHQLAERLDTSDEWIHSRVGIRSRRVVAPGVSTSDLAVEAAKQALSCAGDTDVDAVVLATTTPDHHCPATAPVIAQRLGLGRIPAFDIGAVSSGFVYGLTTAAALLEAGTSDRVLLIGADTFSTIVDPADRTTVPVFGDGAGAVVLRAGTADEPGALHAFDWGSDGALADLLIIPGGGSRAPQGNSTDRHLAMNGKVMYRHAVHRMVESARTVLARACWRAADVDRFVGHQANSRILATVAAELGIPPSRSVSNIATTGNTAAASIPLALADAADNGELTTGDKVLLAAFGGGVTWGASALTWP